jgi:hypothetical protein
MVVTHVSDELGDDWVRAEAEAAFGAGVELARDGAVYVVGAAALSQGAPVPITGE